MPGIALATDRREQFVDVTEAVAAAVAELGVTDGAVLLHVPHTTAAVTINEGFDPDVAADVVDVLAGWCRAVTATRTSRATRTRT